MLSWFFSKNSKSFNENAEVLEDLNTSNEDFELTKVRSSKEVNKTVASLNINNDIVSSIRLAYQKGVIGTQINIQSRTDDSEFNKEFEKYIKLWSKKSNCDVTGRFYRGLLERSLIGYNKIDGGFIIRHHTNRKWDIPYKIEVIPLTRIDTLNDNITNNIVNGLALDEYGELKGIYIFEDSLKTVSKFIDAKDLTLFVIPFVSSTQYSGVSPLAPIIATLDLLSTYNISELEASKQQAEGSIIIKTNLFNTILDLKREKAKIDKLKGGNGLVSEKEIANLYKKFKINGSLDGANYIPKDDEVVNLKSGISSIYEKLDKNSKGTISAGSGLSTQSTIREMPSSYNAALLNANLDEKQYEIDFTDFTELLWRDVIENRLLNALVLSGKIKIKDFWQNSDNYRNVEFIRTSTSHIDPTKVQKANATGLECGTLNKLDIITSDGKDYKQHIKNEIKYKLEKKKIKKQLKKAMKKRKNNEL